MYEIKFIFDEVEYTFTLPEDTLLDVKESDVKFNSKRVSKISEGDEVLIPFFSVYRKMAPVYAMGSETEREVRRNHRAITKEKHLVRISFIALVKEKVPALPPLETVYKTSKHEPLPKLKPIIPINTICEEGMNS